MNRTDRIAALLMVPMLLLVGYQLFIADPPVADGPVVVQETEAPLPVPPGFSRPAEDETGPTTTVAPEVAPVGAAELPPAPAGAPPQEPLGVYKDGKVVLRGSVPSAEAATGYIRRAESVLGPGSVTSEMTLDPRVEGGSMTIDVDQAFRFPQGVDFDPEYGALLDLGVAALQLLPEATLIVTGHTDDRGDEATNLALSQARAQVVVDWMTDRGISPDRVVARGAGESMPIADNSTEEGREANRRVEAVLEGVTPG